MKLLKAEAPHVRAEASTQRIMVDVLIALVPALVAGAALYGPRAVILCALCVGTAMLTEWAFALVQMHKMARADLSAAVTGLLLGLSLPVGVPWFLPVLGAAAAIGVKFCGGGLGNNAFNPALAARALLVWLFPLWMTRFGPAGEWTDLLQADIVTMATPLHEMQMPSLPQGSLWRSFWGMRGGCSGESCVPALLLGFGWLLFRRVSDARAQLGFVGAAAVLTLLFHKTDSALIWMVHSLLSGGLLFGALFMATDYATTPVTPGGRWLFGALAGALTVFFRYTGLFPEGVTYAILLLNPLSHALDWHTLPRRFAAAGGGKRR